ncbi:methyltransferase family protein [Acidobacteriota bacterium]
MNASELKSKIYRWRVRSALFAFILCVVLARPIPLSIGIGILIALLGLSIRAWASGCLKKEKELAVSGPYRLTRNPLYLGNFILGVSVAAASNSLWVTLVFTVYFIMFYPTVISMEKDRMKKLFPDEYAHYSKLVPLFFPRLIPARIGSSHTFAWNLYIHNKEYRALIGTVIFFVILILRMVISL